MSSEISTKENENVGFRGRIKFDFNGDIQEPSFVLSTKGGRKLGVIPSTDIVFKDSMNSYSEISFTVYKNDNGVATRLWNDITDFKLVYSPELNLWFEITLDTNETDETKKSITGKTVCESELSQIMLYGIEINTEDDIARDDYISPTIIYNEATPSVSLLNRIMEKAPHYKIGYVDINIAKIQRTFSFDGVSLYDAFQQIAEEVGCIFVFRSDSDKDGNPLRTIEVYDLMNYCSACNNRVEGATCDKCGSSKLKVGYGYDTGIVVSTENLADEITYSTNTDSVKNCFKVEGGDDIINAAVRNCNPNGTDYIWHITDAVKRDMSKELVDKISSYDTLYAEYQDTTKIGLDGSLLTYYNSLVEKYNPIAKPFGINNGDGFSTINNPIVGFSALMNSYYDVIDMSLFLKSQMMPSAGTSETTASEQCALLTSSNLSPVAVTSTGATSTVVDGAVLGLAKIYIKSSYTVKIKSSSYSADSKTWKGSFTVTNIDNEEDTASSATISVTITTDMVTYVNQKVKRALSKSDNGDLDIVNLFELNDAEFKASLKKYALSSLMIFNNACQGCLDVLIEQGYASDKNADVYSTYKKYYDRLSYIQDEVTVRENEIYIVDGKYDENNTLVQSGLKNEIVSARDSVQDRLDFETFLGNDLWIEFCAYRREDKYTNSNYISDGLNNAELFSKARELLEVASKEIYKSAELQHTISATIKNLFVMKEFKPLRDSFAVGNWIRVIVDDSVYKLRLISYEVDYTDLSNSSVEFSDVLKISSGISDIQSVLKQASSIAGSYSSVVRQAKQGASSEKTIEGWVTDGLALTNSFISNSENQELKLDTNGFLMREWIPSMGAYDDVQLKIINKGLYITDDNWVTAKAGIGSFKYYLPNENGVLEQYEGHGVIADTLVGSFIIGENVGIYSSENNITMDKRGIKVTNGKNTVFISPSTSESVFSISDKNENKKFYISGDGDVTMQGRVIFEQTSSKTYISEKGMDFARLNTEGTLTSDVHVGPFEFAITDENNKTQRVKAFSIISDGAKRDEVVYFARYDSSGIEGCDGTLLPYLVATNGFQRGPDDGGEKTYYWARGLNLMAPDNYQDEFGKAVQKGVICMWNDVYVGTSKIHTYCDSRLKTNIVDSDVSSTSILNDIDIKSFDWIGSGEHISAGLIAQQVEMVLPEVVNTGGAIGDLKSIDYDAFIPYLIKGFQELSERLDDIEDRANTQTVSVAKTPLPVLKAASVIGKPDRWVDDMTEQEKQQYVNMTIPPRFCRVDTKGDI